jgi:hypothetical protein
MAENRTMKPGRKRAKKRTPESAKVPVEQDMPSPLRGLLPTPLKVAQLVAREVERLPMTDEARQRVTDDWTLQYYFGGYDVVYRKTPQGVEVLAAGDEIGQFFRKLPSSQRKGIILGHPEPWR